MRDVIFRDRIDAGRQLAQHILARYPELWREHPIVLGIPRGGVTVAREVANAIGAPLDVFIARKLGAPGQEELGIGAIAPGDTRILDADIIRMLGVSDSYIEDVTRRERAELDRRLAHYRGERPPLEVTGRAVILVDDGLATGVTARAALAALRTDHPSRLLFAAPVCSVEGSALVRREADDALCVAMPDRFYGVGNWYEDFDQVTDEEVLALLRG
jgi:putative phosphoribosyl transferase